MNCESCNNAIYASAMSVTTCKGNHIIKLQKQEVAMNSPCFKCTERHIACHGKCSKYKEFRAACDDRLSHQHKESEAEVALFEWRPGKARR
jgi:hypothetical protein